MDTILSWFGIYWYKFQVGEDIVKVRGTYLEEARSRIVSKCSLHSTNDPCII